MVVAPSVWEIGESAPDVGERCCGRSGLVPAEDLREHVGTVLGLGRRGIRRIALGGELRHLVPELFELTDGPERVREVRGGSHGDAACPGVHEDGDFFARCDADGQQPGGGDPQAPLPVEPAPITAGLVRGSDLEVVAGDLDRARGPLGPAGELGEVGVVDPALCRRSCARPAASPS